MQDFLKDIRYGVRTLLKRPGFTAIAVITLALGIGANTAIFTVVNAALLRPLPFPESERVMWLGQDFPSGPQAAGQPKFIFWREQSQSFESMAAYEGFRGGGNLAGGDEAEYVGGLHVSADFFRVLGVNPIMGRTFTAEDDTPDAAPVAILSERIWRRHFGAEPGLVGKTILLNGKSVAVVGIMPAQLEFFKDADLFEPLRASVKGDPNPNSTVIGRLKPGVTRAQAQAEMRLVADKYRALNPKAMQPGESIAVTPYQQLFNFDVQSLLWILLAAVAFLLLIACANVANLQLTRAAARQKEIAVRLALGASGRRIVKQLLTEGVLLSLCGGLAGLLLAWWGTQLLVAALPEGFISRAREISFDGRVLMFTLAIAAVTGVLFGLAPAWQALRVNVNSALKETARQGGSNTRGRLRGGLVVLEVALSLVLLAGAALLVHSFINLRGVTSGFDSNNVLTFRLDLKGERYDSFARRFLSGVDPFSQTVSIGRGLDDPPRSIVAIVGDVKQFGLDKASPPMVFVPLAQVPDKVMAVVRRFTSTYVAVRTTGAPQNLTTALKREVAGLDPGLPLASVRPMDQIVARSIAPQRFNMWLIAAFAGVGLALAAVGIYGVMSYSVAQRTNELGIRIALGAQTIDVVKLIVRNGITLTLIGIAIGLGGAFALTRLMASLLFGLTPTDALTFVTVTVGLLAVALLACYIPARRATKVDPLVALRYE